MYDKNLVLLVKEQLWMDWETLKWQTDKPIKNNGVIQANSLISLHQCITNDIRANCAFMEQLPDKSSADDLSMLDMHRYEVDKFIADGILVKVRSSD